VICIGATCNAAGILIGGIAGLIWRKQPAAATQGFFKVALGISTVYWGLRLTWSSLDGFSFKTLLQVFTMILALAVGKMIGRLLHLQKASNRVGQFARDEITRSVSGKPRRWSDGFNVCTFLFCAAPLAILGSASDGLAGYFQPLVIKAVMEGLAAMGFVMMFGSSVAVSAVPVFVFESTLTTVFALFAKPLLERHDLLDSVNGTCGLLIFCVALLIFEIKKIEVADYLPALLCAPLLAWMWQLIF
jgi:uncharacterized protein